MLCSMGMAEALGIIIALASPALMAMFDSTPDVVAFGAGRALICGYFFAFLAVSL